MMDDIHLPEDMDAALFKPTNGPGKPIASAEERQVSRPSLWRRLQAVRGTAAALAALAVIVALAILGPILTPFGYNEQLTDMVNLPPRMPALAWMGVADGSRVLYGRRADALTDLEQYPQGSVLKVLREYTSAGVPLCDVKVDYYRYFGLTGEVNFWFGTDYLGRDLWTRMWRGTRLSLVVALAAVAVSIGFGSLYGAIAGYYGGRVDMVLMRVAEVVGAFPQTIVAIMLVMLMGTGVGAIIMALALRGWVGTARLMRGQILRLREQEYVLAARTQGAGSRRVILRHMLPNGVGPIITRAMMEVPGAIFSEALLAFIGLGIQAPEPSLGVLISDAQQVLTSYPYQMVFPAVILSVLMLAFNHLGAGLREALDPVGQASQNRFD